MVSCQGVVQLGGPSSGFSLVSPTKAEARKSFLFTENNSLVLNTWLMFFLFTLFLTPGSRLPVSGPFLEGGAFSSNT